MVAHTYKASTWEAEMEAGKSQVRGQPGIYSKFQVYLSYKTMSQKKKN
jgi:hypothetical protein